MVVASLLYLAAATALMIWRRIGVTPDYLLLLLVPVALMAGRLAGFLRLWLPFIGVLLAWEAMRGLAAQSGQPVHTGALHIDQVLFGGQIPTIRLQDWVDAIHLERPVNLAAAVVYVLHFPTTIAVGLILWLLDERRFVRYSLALLGMSFAAFCVFLVYPTAPPWWAADHRAFNGFDHVLKTALPMAVSPYFHTLNPNPVAAVPSLHAAYAFLGCLVLWRDGGWLRWTSAAWCVVVWITVVYLGEHYVFDVAVGTAWAAAAWQLVNRLPRLVAPLRAVAQPPPA
jgi:hypothetical protein